MKKAFLLLLAVVILSTTVLWANVRTVSAAPLGLTVYVEAFKSKPDGTRVTAEFWADSGWHTVYCVVTENAGYVSCQFPEKYAGQYVWLKLKNDTFLYFYVLVPLGRGTGVPGSEPLTCTPPEEPGADVEFFTMNETTVTYFIPGNSLDEVANNASDMLDDFYLSFEIVSELKCGEANNK